MKRQVPIGSFISVMILKPQEESSFLILENDYVTSRGGGGLLWEFLGGDVPLGPWNP